MKKEFNQRLWLCIKPGTLSLALVQQMYSAESKDFLYIIKNINTYKEKCIKLNKRVMVKYAENNDYIKLRDYIRRLTK